MRTSDYHNANDDYHIANDDYHIANDDYHIAIVILMILKFAIHVLQYDCITFETAPSLPTIVTLIHLRNIIHPHSQ